MAFFSDWELRVYSVMFLDTLIEANRFLTVRREEKPTWPGAWWLNFRQIERLRDFLPGSTC